MNRNEEKLNVSLDKEIHGHIFCENGTINRYDSVLTIIKGSIYILTRNNSALKKVKMVANKVNNKRMCPCLKLLMISVCLLFSINANAYDFEVGGVYYDIISSTDLTCCVTSSQSDAKYSGNVNIRSTITYEGKTFTVTSIGEYAFIECDELTSVTIPNSVTSIGEGAFAACFNLAFVTIPNSVTSIGGSAFNSCRLKSITIPNSVTSIGESAFAGCTELTSVTIPNSITSIEDYIFSSCTGLTSVTIPNSVTSIGKMAFYFCSGLTSVTIPNSVTSIGKGAFYRCLGLTSATIPNGVTTIGNYAYADCTCLTDVVISNSVKNIEIEAFRGCTGLASVTIGSSVIAIGIGAFSNCHNLKEINSLNPIAPNGAYFEEMACQKAILNIPIGSLASYQSENGWKEFYNIKEVDFSGVEQINNDNVRVIADGDEIKIVDAVEYVNIEVYNVNGLLIYRGKDTNIHVPIPGIYVVKVSGRTFKIALF